MKSTITKTIEFDYGHRLLHHNGKCKNLHGHRGKAVIQVEGQIDEDTGMVIDFYHLKRAAVDVINKFDHAMLINPEDEFLIEVCNAGKSLHHIMVLGEPTAENIAYEIRDMVANELQSQNLKDVAVTVTFYETPGSSATTDLLMVYSK